MSTDRIQTFMPAILAEPEDDQARLVLADLYEEVGDLDRATFVRSQVERARLESWDVQCVHLDLQERALFAASGEKWQAELPSIAGVRWGAFRRGLAYRVAFDDVGLLAKHGATCAEAAPISSIVLRWPRLSKRLELEPIANLRELTVIGVLARADDMEWLANSPLLSTVRVLNLVETEMDAEALGLLLASPYMQQLEALRMPYHNFGNLGVEMLVSAKWPNLVDVDVSVPSLDELGSGGRYEATMDGEAARDISMWPALANIRALNLSGNQIGRKGLEAILSSSSAKGLKTLRLRGISDLDGEEEDALPAFESVVDGMSLDELDMSECELDPELAALLADSSALRSLKVLHLNYVQAGRNFRDLSQAAWFDSLRVLYASDVGIDALKGVFARSPKHLHTLKMTSTYYWSRMADIPKALARASPMPSLLVLNLGDTATDDGDLAALGKVASLPNLLSLRMAADDYDEDEPGFSEEAAAAFSDSPLGRQLSSLHLGYEKVDRLPWPEPIAMGDGGYRGWLRFL